MQDISIQKPKFKCRIVVKRIEKKIIVVPSTPDVQVLLTSLLNKNPNKTPPKNKTKQDSKPTKWVMTIYVNKYTWSQHQSR